MLSQISSKFWKTCEQSPALDGDAKYRGLYAVTPVLLSTSREAQPSQILTVVSTTRLSVLEWEPCILTELFQGDIHLNVTSGNLCKVKIYNAQRIF